MIKTQNNEYDVIVVGAGHAGCEAALSSSRIGCNTLLLTSNLDSIAQMPCNPAIGGLAKGHLVGEIDALGGQMAKCIDKTGIQFRMLNTSKGPAVRALRAQADKHLYRLEMKAVIERQGSLSVKQEVVSEILTNDTSVSGVKTELGTTYLSKTVIIATGTFLNGLIHIGLEHFPAGRAGEVPSLGLSNSLKALGFKLGRLKTGTCARLDRKTIDFSSLVEQKSDSPPTPFSYFDTKIVQPQRSCYITYTNPKTHQVINDNLKYSPLYTGKIAGTGPRYCPSIEDKVMRFPEKDRHQIFLEPEGLNTEEIYANGLSTSLPLDAQISFLRTIAGLENVEIMRPGYAVEYDFVPPTQIFSTLETKNVKGLFHAGQINGTSGYEEAAAQGLMAGINAAAFVQKREMLILKRSEAYIGVLIDDLVTKGTNEPYRMFTSRAEYRLLLRQDNADFRLTEHGKVVGLVTADRYESFLNKKSRVEKGTSFLKKIKINPDTETNVRLKESAIGEINNTSTASDLLKRPGVTIEMLAKIRQECSEILELGDDAVSQIEINVKYEGYIKRQNILVDRTAKLDLKKIPSDFDFKLVPGLSGEVREKLVSIRPASIGQASRISGVTPSAITVLLIFLKKSENVKLKAKE